VAASFFQALLNQDRSSAYALLDEPSKARVSREQFNLLAASYRRNLGFEPEDVRIRACEEQGSMAMAHVVIVGHDAKRTRRYRDAVQVLRSNGGWLISLPYNFGQSLRSSG
jgi:hypothetical protein